MTKEQERLVKIATAIVKENEYLDVSIRYELARLVWREYWNIEFEERKKQNVKHNLGEF